MEKLVKGDVVVLPFPFSDLSASKKRPAYVLAKPNDGELILCQITSSLKIDSYSIALSSRDFKIGSIHITSIIKPNRIFTADTAIVLNKIGTLKSEKIKEIDEAVINIIRN